MQALRLATASAAALAASLFAPGAWAACYVIYGADQQVIYRSQTPPVDLSRNLHETVPRVAPGGTLVFSLDSYGCELEINRLPAPVAGPRKDTAGTSATPRTPRANRS